MSAERHELPSVPPFCGGDWAPTAPWPQLRARADLLRRVRSFFDARGFVEVETPLLSADVVVDRHLDPFAVECGAPQPRWLQTSPEFHMKRLLAAGAPAIYQVTRAFRQGELGPRHNPEFTLVEWYQPGAGYAPGMRLLGELVAEMLATPPAQTLTYGEAFARFAQVDPHRATLAELAATAARAGLEVPSSMAGSPDRDAWLDLLLVELIEPNLGVDAPQLLCDYPPSQAALAQVRPGDPPVAERFEIYYRGIELANGYHELLDAHVLRERNQAANRWRLADGKAPLPGESRLLSAMEAGLPPSVGVALGFDRLLMLATGADHLRQVTAFPWDIA